MFLGVATVLLDGEGDTAREDLLAALLLGALGCQTLFAAGTTPGVAWGHEEGYLFSGGEEMTIVCMLRDGRGRDITQLVLERHLDSLLDEQLEDAFF